MRGLARWHRLVGILILQLIEREADAVGETHRFSQRIRPLPEQPRHIVRRAQMAFGVGLQFAPGRRDRHLLTDAAQHVLQRPTLMHMIEHVVGSDQRHARRRRDPFQPRHAPLIVTMMMQ